MDRYIGGWTYGKVVGELGSDDAVGAVGAGHLAPHNAEAGAGLVLSLALVDISDLLAQIVVGGGLVVDAIDADQGGVVVGVSTAALVAEDGTVDVETRGLGHFGG